MNKKGFTLIEIVMIIVLLGIIMPGIMLYFIEGVKDSAYSQRRTTAVFLAQALMEEIQSKGWDETTTINGTCSNATFPLSIEEGIANRNQFDDIDDFDNLNNAPPKDSQGTDLTAFQGFRQEAAVIYVDPADLDSPAVAPPTCYKRILVRITDTGSGEKTELVSLRTSY